MELTVMLKDQAPHALPHGAFFRIDPQDRGALRQGNIALIHSAPTGDKNRKIRSSDERSDIRAVPVFFPDVAEPVIGRAFARAVGSSGLRNHQWINAQGGPSSSRPTAPG